MTYCKQLLNIVDLVNNAFGPIIFIIFLTYLPVAVAYIYVGFGLMFSKIPVWHGMVLNAVGWLLVGISVSA